ncbi:hypothetical protein Ae201684P_015994 [Aphanomyces euteiches]|nr:hypothetical protein Ae201684P_015994 [Aphanomyces euteiches]
MMNDMVEEIRRPTTTASFTRWSFGYNIIFILNLVTTPFTAYLTEPRPGEHPLENCHLHYFMDSAFNLMRRIL